MSWWRVDSKTKSERTRIPDLHDYWIHLVSCLPSPWENKALIWRSRTPPSKTGHNWPQDTRNDKDIERRTGWNKVFTGIRQGGAFLCSTMPQAGDWWEGLRARTISAPTRTSLDVAEETRGRRRSGNPVRDKREREDWEWSSERLNRRRVTVPDATN